MRRIAKRQSQNAKLYLPIVIELNCFASLPDQSWSYNFAKQRTETFALFLPEFISS